MACGFRRVRGISETIAEGMSLVFEWEPPDGSREGNTCKRLHFLLDTLVLLRSTFLRLPGRRGQDNCVTAV